jgi:hypothetical protein
MPGHVGHIYRAKGGGRYTGRATPRTLHIFPDGSVFSPRSRAKVTGAEIGAAGVVRELLGRGAPTPADAYGLRGWAALAAMTQADRARWLTEALAAAGARRVRHGGNHRYVWTLGDKSARRRIPIALDARPYPTSIDRVAA